MVSPSRSQSPSSPRIGTTVEWTLKEAAEKIALEFLKSTDPAQKNFGNSMYDDRKQEILQNAFNKLPDTLQKQHDAKKKFEDLLSQAIAHYRMPQRNQK